MSINTDVLLQTGVTVLCLATLLLHTTRKNRNEALLYGLQSLAVAAMLATPLLRHFSWSLLAIVVLTLAIKVVFAPFFFIRLVRRHELRFTASTYANMPETFLLLAGVLVLAASPVLAPLTQLVSAHHAYGVLSLAAMLASVLLMANRKGALSQAVGVLSLENSIVAFAVLAGLEESPVLQVGVIFDIAVWLVVAAAMLLLVYRHHGSLDVSAMKKLQDQ